MAETVYIYHGPIPEAPAGDIRWLAPSEYEVFARHLALCGQKPLPREIWDELEGEGTAYCGLFADGEMVARAAVERYSEDLWEVSDVRTAKPYRNRGYAEALCRFVMRLILDSGRTPTIRTEDDNAAMRRVIGKLGFEVYLA